MLIKEITHISLFILITASFVSSAKFPGYCRDCEEEVWEEVPCATLSNSTTTTTPAPPITLPPIITTTIPPPPPIYTTPSPPITLSPIEVIPPLLPPLPPAPIAAAFKKCYCECKAGCREFCRKTLVTPDVEKTITQVSKTAQTIPAGIIEIQHLHQRNFVPTAPYVPAPPVPAPPPPAPIPYVPAPAPLPVPVPPPAPPAPLPYNTKPYPASGSSCGTIYPVESSAEMDDICGGSCPSYNNPPAPQQPTKYYPNQFDFTGFNSVDDLAQLLRSASYSPGNVYYPSAPSASAAPNNYPSYPPPPPGAPISLPPPPNNYPSYPPPPPVGPSPPKLSKYSTSPKSYKRPPVYGKSPVSNSGPSAAAAATAEVKSPSAPNANCPGCSGSKPNENIDLSLGDYYKDYLFSNSAAGSDYPAYQLTYPISY